MWAARAGVAGGPSVSILLGALGKWGSARRATVRWGDATEAARESRIRPVIELRRPLALVQCNLPTRSNARSPPRLANFSCSYYTFCCKLFIVAAQFCILNFNAGSVEHFSCNLLFLNMYVFLSISFGLWTTQKDIKHKARRLIASSLKIDSSACENQSARKQKRASSTFRPKMLVTLLVIILLCMLSACGSKAKALMCEMQRGALRNKSEYKIYYSTRVNCILRPRSRRGRSQGEPQSAISHLTLFKLPRAACNAQNEHNSNSLTHRRWFINLLLKAQNPEKDKLIYFSEKLLYFKNNLRLFE